MILWCQVIPPKRRHYNVDLFITTPQFCQEQNEFGFMKTAVLESLQANRKISFAAIQDALGRPILGKF